MPESETESYQLSAQTQSGERTATLPLGTEGMSARVDDLLDQPKDSESRNQVDRLITKLEFMASYAQELFDWKVISSAAIREQHNGTKLQIKTLALKVSGGDFLTQLNDPNSELGKLALKHAVTQGIRERVDSVGSSLPKKYTDLADRLRSGFGTGTKEIRPQGREAVHSTASTRGGVEGQTKVDENLGSLENQQETRLVQDIRTALDKGEAQAFLYNRHVNRPSGETNLDFRNLRNISHETAYYLYTLVSGLSNKHSLVPESAQLLHITAPSNLEIPWEINALPASDKKIAISKCNGTKVSLRSFQVLKNSYKILHADDLDRPGEFDMFLICRADLAKQISDYAVRRGDDPTAATRIIGHALGEDLDIKWEENGVKQYAELNVKSSKIVRV